MDSEFKMPTSGRHIFAFGQGENGRLGLNNQENTMIPRPISFQPPSKIILLAAGGGHSLALTEQGAVYAWGANSSGQLGLGDKDSALAPLRVKALSEKKVVHVDTGDNHSAAVTDDGELYTWGSGGHIVKGIGGLGHGSKTNVLSPKLVEALKGVKLVQVACGGAHSAALSDKGEIFTWGKGDYGRLGHGDSFNQPLPKKLEFFNVAEQTPMKLSLGRNFSAVLTQQGEIYMFGKNEHFQLGFESAGNLLAGGNFDGEKVPVLLKFFPVAGLKVKDVACGDFFTACVTTNGDAFVWGKGIYEPTKIKIPVPCEQVSVGRDHVAFTTSTGEVYLFGSPQHGQLGTTGSILSSTQTLHNIPKKQIPGKVVQAAAGHHFTLCLVDMEKI